MSLHFEFPYFIHIFALKYYISSILNDMITHPCAKINLGLNVVSKRPDGYHNLETVFYPVPLCDTLEINVSEGTTTLSLSGTPLEGDPEQNLVIKAYRAVCERYHLPEVNISLDKHIPSQAGMGGGSSDCAFTIKALNEMFNIGMDNDEMREIASRLGADCPFFIDPTPSFAQGIGENLQPIDFSLEGFWISIIKPPFAVSTREAFSRIVPKHPAERCDSIVLGDMKEWRNSLVNDFEESVFNIHPVLADIKRRFYDMGAVYSCMSGSGSAMVALFENEPPVIEGEYYKLKL